MRPVAVEAVLAADGDDGEILAVEDHAGVGREDLHPEGVPQGIRFGVGDERIRRPDGHRPRMTAGGDSEPVEAGRFEMSAGQRRQGCDAGSLERGRDIVAGQAAARPHHPLERIRIHEGIVERKADRTVALVVHHAAQGHRHVELAALPDHEGPQVVLIGEEHPVRVVVPDIILIASRQKGCRKNQYTESFHTLTSRIPILRSVPAAAPSAFPYREAASTATGNCVFPVPRRCMCSYRHCARSESGGWGH